MKDLDAKEAISRLLELGNQFKTRGDLIKAEEFYRTALELDPENALAFNNLGELAMHIEQYDTAAFLFQQAIQYNHINTEFQENLTLANKKLNSQI